MRTSAPKTTRHLGLLRRTGLVAASVVAGTFGVGVLSAGAALAQGTHHAHLSTAKHRLTAHERLESSSVRASETSSNDPSPNDEGSTDTSSSDVNDSQDSVDSASISLH